MKKSLLTLLFFLTKLAISALLVYLAYIIPGKQETSLRFVDYVIDVKTGLLAASAIVLIILTHYLMKFGSWLSVLPSKIRAYLAQRRLEKSKENVLESFVSMASGEYDLATKLSGRAQYLDPSNQFAPIFFAQASFMKGDYKEAEKQFQNLLKTPQTRFLGLRGLISLRQKQNRLLEVQGFLEDILRDRPNSPWALNQLFTLTIQQGSLDKAEELVLQLKSSKALTSEKASRHRGILYWLKAKQALEEKKFDLAESLLTQALKQEPTLTPASLALACLYEKLGKFSKAQKCLIKGYEARPDKDYLTAIEELMAEKSFLDCYQFAESLTTSHDQAPESHFILASLALKAQLWGQARFHLNLLKEKRPTRSYYELKGKLDAVEPGYQTGERENQLTEMLHATQDPKWVCQDCHHSVKSWEASCPSCNGFDTLVKESG